MMGWWKNRKMKKRFRSYEQAVGKLREFSAKDWGAYLGKDAAELAREGGWDVVAGTDWSWLNKQWQSAGSIWQNYTVRDMEIAYTIASTIHAVAAAKPTLHNPSAMRIHSGGPLK